MLKMSSSDIYWNIYANATLTETNPYEERMDLTRQQFYKVTFTSELTQDQFLELSITMRKRKYYLQIQLTSANEYPETGNMANRKFGLCAFPEELTRSIKLC